MFANLVGNYLGFPGSNNMEEESKASMESLQSELNEPSRRSSRKRTSSGGSALKEKRPPTYPSNVCRSLMTSIGRNGVVTLGKTEIECRGANLRTKVYNPFNTEAIFSDLISCGNISKFATFYNPNGSDGYHLALLQVYVREETGKFKAFCDLQLAMNGAEMDALCTLPRLPVVSVAHLRLIDMTGPYLVLYFDGEMELASFSSILEPKLSFCSVQMDPTIVEIYLQKKKTNMTEFKQQTLEVRRSSRLSSKRLAPASTYYSPPPPARKRSPAPVIPAQDLNLTFLNYPRFDKAYGSIRLTYGDIARLQPEEFLNDSLIDFYFCFTKKHLLPAYGDGFYHFSTQFYSMLESSREPEYVRKLHRWTRNAAIFDRNVVFIPVNLNAHWSLVVLLNPAFELGDDESRAPCLLFLDSLKIHNQRQIRRKIYECLEVEWEHRKGTKRTFNHSTFPCRMPSVPLQTNAYDCGLFVCLYGWLMLKTYPFGGSSHDVKQKFPRLRETAFNHLDVLNFRDHLRQMIYLIRQMEEDFPTEEVKLDYELADFQTTAEDL